MADKSKALNFGSGCKGSIADTVMLITQESLKAKNEWLEPSEEGMIGTNNPTKDGRQLKKIDVSGDVTVRPSYAHADAILEAFLDDTVEGTYTPAANPESKTAAVVLDRGVDIYTYAACWLGELEISGKENEPLDWKLSLLGTTETDEGTVAALTPPDRMRFSDLSGGVSIDGNAYFPQGFSLKFSNALVERFLNSLTRSVAYAHIQRLDLSLEFDENADTFADLFALAGTNTALSNVVLLFTNGTASITITIPEMTVMNPEKWADGDGVDARTRTLELRAWKHSTDPLFTIAYSAGA